MITPLEQLRTLRPRWRTEQQQCVLTNGVFDLLHAGHVAYLQQARALGDMLVVALNSDTSARAIKGPGHPLVAEEDRALVLAALRCVDYVTVFAQPTAEEVVAVLQPDVYAKGGDYATSQDIRHIDETRLPEARVVRGYGGQVALLPYRHGFSTTALIEKIRQTMHNR
jgi:rfaE bifunctional protein nucleotidyltransferase chain/domain